MAEILVADIPEGIMRVRSAVASYHAVVGVETIRAAETELSSKSFDLVIVGVQFDESQGYEFLFGIKRSLNNFRTPILVVRQASAEMGDSTDEVIGIVCKALDTCNIVNVAELQVSSDDPHQRLLEEIELCLPTEKRKVTRSRSH